MDSRGGCCIARYTGGGTYDMSKMARIMLRYRPIAPKPPVGGYVCGDSAPEKNGVNIKNGRGKRRYVKDNDNNSSNNNNIDVTGGNKRCRGKKTKASPEETVVTLPLLPETPDIKGCPVSGSSCESGDMGVVKKPEVGGEVLMIQQQAVSMVMSSCVKVEYVTTDTWINTTGLGLITDKEKVMNLEKDTFPGFISDGLNRVRWLNGAYKEMVGGGEAVTVTVQLVMKDGVQLPVTCEAFTCHARVKNSKNSWLTLPCDVWRMDCGGFAWRLDIKAALSLGR